MQHWENNCIEFPWLFRRVLSGAVYSQCVRLPFLLVFLLPFLLVFLLAFWKQSFHYHVVQPCLSSLLRLGIVLVNLTKRTEDVKDGKPLNILWQWEVCEWRTRHQFCYWAVVRAQHCLDLLVFLPAVNKGRCPLPMG